MVELDVKITSGDLYDFLLRHSYNSVSGLLGAVIGALGLIVGISRQYWIYLILGVVILLYLPWTLYIKSKQQAVNNPVFKEPLHYVLDENGITISQGDSSTCQKWEDCLKLYPPEAASLCIRRKIMQQFFLKVRCRIRQRTLLK